MILILSFKKRLRQPGHRLPFKQPLYLWESNPALAPRQGTDAAAFSRGIYFKELLSE